MHKRPMSGRFGRRSVPVLLTLGLVLSIVFWSAATAPPASALPDGFQDELLWGGFVNPTALAFAPNGSVFVAEKQGTIRRFDGLTDTTGDLVIDLRALVHNRVDRGLLGLAVDPNFSATRPFIYVQYTYDHILGSTAAPPRWGSTTSSYDNCPTPPGETGDGCVVSGRISKLVLSSPTGPVASEQVLVEDWCQQFPSHSIGTIVFGADGKLYAGGGDGASYNYVDYGQAGGSSGSPTPANPCGDPPGAVGTALTSPTAQGGALRSQAPGVGARSSITGKVTLDGSIIRIDPDTGQGVPGNPWFSRAGADDNEKRIIAYGLRNPFRFSFRGGTNELWLGDVGWTETEELNIVPDPTTMSEPVNFGWPCYEGDLRHPGYEAAGLGVCEDLYARGDAAVRFPHYSYGHAEHPVATDGCATNTGSAITGAAYYNLPTGPGATPYPARYDGALFFTDYNRKCLWVMLNGANGRPDPTKIEAFANFPGGVVDLVAGPSGDIFYPNLETGEIRRIRYFPANTPPLASFTATPSSGPAPLAVTFDASGSTDADGDPLTYAWDLDGDGQYDDATGVTTNRTYAAGTTTVGLRVNDSGGATATTSRLVSSGNSAPAVTINGPSPSATWKVGDSIPFSGSATDPENGSLAPSRLSWLVRLLTCDALGGNCVVRSSYVYDGVASGTQIAPDWGGEGNNVLEFALTATDLGGLSATKVVRILPQNVTLTFESSPSGLTLGIGSETKVTPFTRTVILGSTNSLNAPSHQVLANSTYQFSSWSDGGTASHNVTASAATSTYRATYTTTARNGLVAALGFDEGTGTAATDTSGFGNHGLAEGTTWNSAGRFGKALTFNGTSSWVSVADAPSLDLTNAMTLEAWVRPTAVADWQCVLMKENPAVQDFVYGVMSSSPYGGAGGWVNLGNAHAAESASALPLNTWTHVAATYDGTNVRYYQNGALVATVAAVGAMADSSGFLRIGGNGIWGEWFQGSIDEVRVYTRALSAAEVVADRDAPITGTKDSTPPSAPGTLAATGGVGSVALSWGAATDNVGVTGYDVHRSTTSGFTPSAANRIAQPSGTTFTDAVAAGTYYYRVTAHDAAGLVGPASNQATATATADSTAPSVSLTAPANGATVSGSVALSATATDNVAVTGVQFKVDGSNLGAEDTTAPFATTWDSTAVTNGSHTVSAVARDGAGNLSTASTVTVTVTNTAPTGLVAAYGFNEGAGTIASDASGLGNTGVITNATWNATGRFGRAVSFNGTSSLVTVADAASLDLTSAMTLEAWVNPTTVNDWQTVLVKENSVGNDFTYGVMSNTPYGGPGGWVNIGGARSSESPTRLAANTWTHVAATFDGANLRFYRNGTLTTTVAVSGAMTASTGALRIGGNNIWGEWFAGSIDEVRVYNRALTATQITTDMNTAIATGPVDSTPPSAPGTLSATGGVGSVALSWGPASDNVGVAGYDVHRSTTPGFTPTAANRIAQPSGTTYTDAVAPGTYSYRVIARDAAGNVGPASNQATATAATDATAPTATLTAPVNGAVVSGAVALSATASDNVAVAGVQFEVDGVNLGSEDTTAPYSTTWTSTSATNGNHTVSAVARDAAGNLSATSTVTVTVANTAPTGLVAAYGFNEGAGTSAGDSSGSGNVATTANTTWNATGRFGRALTFNGTSSMVTVADAASLDLTNAMTLEAWVNPTTVNDWQTLIMKENTARDDFTYGIESNTPYGGPGGWVNIGGARASETPTRLVANTWTHVAATYDGTNLRLYRNGTLVTTVAVTGSMVAGTGALRIGGNSIWGEWFAGSIDEVRVYNRALTAAQITTDMNTAV